MYPRKSHPYSGIFVEEQVQALKRLIKGNITVISPIPWSPKLLWFRKKWREYGETESKEVREGINVYYPRYFVIPGKFFSSFSGIFMYCSVRTLIKRLIGTEKRKTILHAHTILPMGLAVIFLKKELDLKIVCTAHGSDINLYPYRSKLSYIFTKYVLNRADSLIAVSEKLKKKIQDIVNRNDIRVVTNGVDHEKVAGKATDIISHAVERDATTILFVGTLCFEKGVRELLQAFKLLRNEYKHLSLIMLGNNLMPKWIDSFITENHLKNCIELAGNVDHKEIRKYYSRASIFTLPSYSEGMPTVMFEAMANKLPIIISRVGGVEEVINDGINGMLVKAGSVQDLYEKLKLLIEDEKLRNLLSENAFYDALSNYTWDHNAEKMCIIYKKMLNE
jgi:teichuronic acid biosynthesis glycosyltransferase TuaC